MIEQPPMIEGWVSYTYWRFHMSLRLFGVWGYPSVYIAQGMNIKIQQAMSDTGGWSNFGASQAMVDKISAIIAAAVFDFREAYGAAFDDAAKNDGTLVPISCLTYVDATVFYNISAAYALYSLKADGVTKEYLTDYFEPAWKDAAVYRRAIALTRRQYRDEINAIVNAEGKPLYISKTERSSRTL
jgi:hypothetical protein